jgi:hypothetical protein
MLDVYLLLSRLLEKPAPAPKFRWQLAPDFVFAAHGFVLENHGLRDLENGKGFE